MTKGSEARRIRKRLKSLPDPLRGAALIFAAPDAATEAAEIVAEHNAGPFGRDLIVHISEALAPGEVVGLDKHSKVCVRFTTEHLMHKRAFLLDRDGV